MRANPQQYGHSGGRRTSRFQIATDFDWHQEAPAAGPGLTSRCCATHILGRVNTENQGARPLVERFEGFAYDYPMHCEQCGRSSRVPAEVYWEQQSIEALAGSADSAPSQSVCAALGR